MADELFPTTEEALRASDSVSNAIDDAKKICIDSESDDDEDLDDTMDVFARNFGLPYSDHNYDVPDKSKRRSDIKKTEFPRMPDLDKAGCPVVPEVATETRSQQNPAAVDVKDNNIGNLRHIVTHSGAQPRIHPVPTTIRARIDGNPANQYMLSPAPQFIQQKRVVPQGTPTPVTFSNSPQATSYRRSNILPTRPPTITGMRAQTTAIRAVPATRGDQNVETAAVPTDAVMRRPDIAPHRFNLLIPEQRLYQQQIVTTRPAFSVIEGSKVPGAAPMLVPSRGAKLLVRGKAGSEMKGKKEDELELHHASPDSPRKVHFSEEQERAEGHPLARLAPQQKTVKPTPPHRMTLEERNVRLSQFHEKDKLKNVISKSSTDSKVTDIMQKKVPVDTVTSVRTTEQSDLRTAQEQERAWIAKDIPADGIKKIHESIILEIEQEKVLRGSAEKRKSAVIANTTIPARPGVGVDPVDEPIEQRPGRGRPKGTNRNRWSASSGSNESEHITPSMVPTAIHHLVGSGARILSPQQRLMQPLPPVVFDSTAQRRLNGSQSVVKTFDMNGASRSGVVAATDSDSESEAETETNAQDDFGNWEMRCYCGLTHSEGFTIECESCKDWQHGECMGLREDSTNDGYQCEICCPRPMPLTATDAKRIQQRILKDIEKLRAKSLSGQKKVKGKRGRKSNSAKNETPIVNQKTMVTPKITRKSSIEGNEYSRKSVRLLCCLDSTVGAAALLRETKNIFRAQRKTLQEGLNIQGLVTSVDVEPRQVVMELTGLVCLPQECGRHTSGIVPFVFQYDGLMKGPQGEDINGPEQEELICIDCREIGNDAKFVRRSCVPNCVLKHVLEATTLGIMIVATRNITANAEITIPFDCDWRKSPNALVCTEHQGDKIKHCPYEIERNRHANFSTLTHRAWADSLDTKILKQSEKKEKSADPPKTKKEEEVKKEENQRASRASTSAAQPISTLSTPVVLESTENAARSEGAKKRKGRPSKVTPNEAPDEDKNAQDIEEAKRSRRKSPVRREAIEDEIVDYSLPADRNKLSREERKTQALLAQIAKQEQLDRKKMEKMMSPKSKTPEEKKTKEEKISRTTPKSAIDEKSSSPIRDAGVRTRKTREGETTAAEASSSSTTTRRHRAVEAKQDSPATENHLAKAKKQATKRPFEKDGEKVNHKNRKTENIQGLSWSDLHKAIMDNAKKVISLHGNVEFTPPMEKVAKKEKVEMDIKPKEEKVEEIPAETSTPQPKKQVKKLSIADYKKRRSTTSEEAVVKNSSEKSFIPSIEGTQGPSGVANPSFIRPSLDVANKITAPTASLAELRNEVYGNSETPKPSIVDSPRMTRGAMMQSAKDEDQPRESEGFAPQMSLKERLEKEFGVGSGSEGSRLPVTNAAQGRDNDSPYNRLRR